MQVHKYHVNLVHALALAEGRKHADRTMIFPQPVWGGAAAAIRGWQWCLPGREPLRLSDVPAMGSPWQVGDLLWLCEPWTVIVAHLGRAPRTADEAPPVRDLERARSTVYYPADTVDVEACCYPATYMPPWASRFTARVTHIRLQRLHDLSCEEIVAEGVHVFRPEVATQGEAQAVYAADWDRRQVREGCEFASNPWAWVLEWEVVKANIGDVMRDVTHHFPAAATDGACVVNQRVLAGLR